MASRQRCSKRGSTGKDGLAGLRKPLEDISSLHNSIQPCTRKSQKVCSIEGPSEPKQPVRPRAAKPVSKKSFAKKVAAEPVLMADGGSDFDEQSSDSSPHEPLWFRSVPQKHRKAIESILENTGVPIPPAERELIIHDCCIALKIDGYVEEFLEWMAAHERVSSLTTKLCQTGVGSPVSFETTCGVGHLYADEIYDNLLAREDRFAIKCDYMETVQRDVTHNMRSILIDWLVEVGEEYKLSSQTFFLAVNYVDRLLGMRPVNRNKLQLIGITCMLVAAKYEEIYPPTIDEFVYISDNTYSRNDVLTMESVLLTSLQFSLSAPTSWEFVRSFCASASIGERPKFLAHFLSELFMMFPCCLKYRPSLISASSIFLALYTLHLPPWPSGLVELAGNKNDLLQCCIEELSVAHKKVLSENHSLKAIREKFQESKWMRVSLIPSRALDFT